MGSFIKIGEKKKVPTLVISSRKKQTKDQKLYYTRVSWFYCILLLKDRYSSFFLLLLFLSVFQNNVAHYILKKSKLKPRSTQNNYWKWVYFGNLYSTFKIIEMLIFYVMKFLQVLNSVTVKDKSNSHKKILYRKFD